MSWSISRRFQMKRCKRYFFCALVVVVLSLYVMMPSKTRNRLRTSTFLNESVDIDGEDHFREVVQDVFLHSAYWDQRQTPNRVRILAIAPRSIDKSESNLSCYLNYGDYAIRADVFKRILIEHWNLNFTAVFYLCKIDDDLMPLAVSLSYLRENRNFNNTIKWISVKNLTVVDRNADNLAVCVRPLFGPYNNTFQLAEFIAYYSAMGAVHFHFLDLDTSPEVKKFFAAVQNIQSSNFTVNFEPWNIPRTLDIWQYGQVVANQYCVLKLMPRYKYVALVDVDEFIVSRLTYHRSFLRLIRLKDMDWIGSFMFRNAFFRNSVKNCQGDDFLCRSRLWNYKARSREVFNPRVRSKVIVKPESVLEQAIHFVGTPLPGYASLVFDTNEALLHHYRNDLSDGITKLDNDTVFDSYACDRYGDLVKSSKVLAIWKNLFYKET